MRVRAILKLGYLLAVGRIQMQTTYRQSIVPSFSPSSRSPVGMRSPSVSSIQALTSFAALGVKRDMRSRFISASRLETLAMALYATPWWILIYVFAVCCCCTTMRKDSINWGMAGIVGERVEMEGGIAERSTNVSEDCSWLTVAGDKRMKGLEIGRAEGGGSDESGMEGSEERRRDADGGWEQCRAVSRGLCCSELATARRVMSGLGQKGQQGGPCPIIITNYNRHSHTYCTHTTPPSVQYHSTHVASPCRDHQSPSASGDTGNPSAPSRAEQNI